MKCKFGKAKNIINQAKLTNKVFFFSVIIAVFFLFNTCKKEKKGPYYLTDDQKSWVIYKNNTPQFLFNNKDTCQISAGYGFHLVGEGDGAAEIGSVMYDFNKNDSTYKFLCTTYIHIEANGNNEPNIYFDICARKAPILIHINNDKIKNTTLITMNVNNITYQNVYKFEFEKSIGLKEAYFVKGIGFIKMTDWYNNIIELIK